jgi:hypothetical protein
VNDVNSPKEFPVQIGESPRSVLETPLNWIFSSEANVRILRELCLVGSPLSKTEIAHRSGISTAGVVKALPRLFDTGTITAVGTGTRQVIAIREAHPLTSTLHLLFMIEALQKKQLTDELGQIVSKSKYSIKSAWLDESTQPSPRAPLSLGVIASSEHVSAIQDELRDELGTVSARFGVTLELNVRTVPDLAIVPAAERERLQTVTVVYGPNPLLLAGSSIDKPEPPHETRPHFERENQSLRRAMWIARMLDRDPTFPQRARNWIVHRLQTTSSREAADLQEWLHLLESAPISTIQYVLLRVDERSDRLRQTNPFIMSLTPDERRRMVEETVT